MVNKRNLDQSVVWTCKKSRKTNWIINWTLGNILEKWTIFGARWDFERNWYEKFCDAGAGPNDTMPNILV